MRAQAGFLEGAGEAKPVASTGGAGSSGSRSPATVHDEVPADTADDAEWLGLRQVRPNARRSSASARLVTVHPVGFDDPEDFADSVRNPGGAPDGSGRSSDQLT